MTFSLFGCKKKNYNYYDQTIRKTYASDDAIFDVGANANNERKYASEVNRLIDTIPSKRQYEYSKLKYYNFIHFGMNTFTNKEWGDGKTSPSKFNPKTVDTDQWAKVLKASGSKGIILTAKHHDGFCLWDSAYTDYDVASSPYKKDIVKQLADSCKKYDLKFGVYLSPWDMHEKTYGKNTYNEFFKNQLTELLTNYGELFSIWFDGARGEGVEMDADFNYDWDGYYELIRKYQPNAVICVSGPDVRWVGNEAGVSREAEWNVIGKGYNDPDYVASISQKDEQSGEALKNLSFDSSDLGSREIVKNFEDLIWAPAEVDVSIHKGWFFHKFEKPKDLEHLLQIYYKAVGGNSSLLLNIPPNKDGVIAQKDVERLEEFGNAIAKRFENKISATAKVGTSKNLTQNDALTEIVNKNGTFEMASNDYVIDLKFDKARIVNTIELEEDIRYSQRVEKFSVYLQRRDGSYTLVSNSTVIGSGKLILLDPSKDNEAKGLRIVIEESRHNPVLSKIAIYS